MDEYLPSIQELWDPETATSVRERLRDRPAPARVDKEKNLRGFQRAYEAAGGDDRLAHEFNQNFAWWMGKFGHRILPDEKTVQDINLTIVQNIPRTELDGEYTDVTETGAHPGDGNQLPQGSAAPRIGGPPGTEDTASQDGRSGAFCESQDTPPSRTGTHS